MERSASARSGLFGFCLAPPSSPPMKAKTRRHSSVACPSEHRCNTRIRVGQLVSNTLRPLARNATACQDTLRAFLAEWGISGLFYHSQLAKHLARSGLEVHQIDRQDNHAHVWVLKVRRGQVRKGEEVRWVQKQVCLFLKRYGLRYPKKEVVVMVQGNRIKAAFNWERGEPGWLSYDRPKAGRRSGNQT